MALPSLDSIAKRYGQFETFGHKDYEEARKAGYTNQEIKDWLDQDLDSRLHPDNMPGSPSGLYDEISRNAVDYTKAVNIDREAILETGETGGMTPFEYDYQKTLDIANIDKQIKQMQLEAAENIEKLSNMNKVTIANKMTNQSILSGLVNAFSF